MRAPLARAIVVSIGLVWPSSGVYRAPIMPSVLIPGYSSSRRVLSIISDSTPNTFAIDDVRLISSRRASVRANEMLPIRL